MVRRIRRLRIKKIQPQLIKPSSEAISLYVSTICLCDVKSDSFNQKNHLHKFGQSITSEKDLSISTINLIMENKHNFHFKHHILKNITITSISEKYETISKTFEKGTFKTIYKRKRVRRFRGRRIKIRKLRYMKR